MLKHKLMLLILLNLILNKSNVSGCKADWDSTCKTNGDCCSAFCDNSNGQWAFGICKPSTTTKKPETTFKLITLNSNCKEDWSDDCYQNTECCSMICEIKANWMKGFCRPNVTMAPTTRKWGCLKDWDDSCEKDDDCCSHKCDKQNDGKWDYGVCQPINTPKNFLTTKSTRSTTTKIYNYRGTPESPLSKSTPKSITKSTYYSHSKSSTKSTYLTQSKNRVTIKEEKLACECVCKNSLGQSCNQGNAASASTSTVSTTRDPNCKQDWFNSCTKNADCCSLFCDNLAGKWQFGICKPNPNTPSTTSTSTKWWK